MASLDPKRKNIGFRYRFTSVQSVSRCEDRQSAAAGTDEPLKTSVEMLGPVHANSLLITRCRLRGLRGLHKTVKPTMEHMGRELWKFTVPIRVGLLKDAFYSLIRFLGPTHRNKEELAARFN